MSNQNLTDSSQPTPNGQPFGIENPNRSESSSSASVGGGDNLIGLSSYVDKPGVTAGGPYVNEPGVMAGSGTEPSNQAGRTADTNTDLRECFSCRKSIIHGSYLNCVKCSEDYHADCIQRCHKWRGYKWEFLVELLSPAKEQGFQYVCWRCDPNILPLPILLLKEKYIDQEFLKNVVKSNIFSRVMEYLKDENRSITSDEEGRR